MTLAEIIAHLWTTYIFKPHRHDWQLEKTFRDYVSVMSIEAESTGVIYKCSICGKVIRLEKTN